VTGTHSGQLAPREVAAALTAALERRAPSSQDVVRWNEDRRRRQLGSRGDDWPDPPGLNAPRVRVRGAGLEDALRSRGYDLVDEEPDVEVVTEGEPTGDAPWIALGTSDAVAAAFPRVVIMVVGARGDDTGKMRTAYTREAARRTIADLDARNEFAELSVLVGLAPSDETTSDETTDEDPNLRRVIDEVIAEAAAAAEAAGVEVAPGETPPSEFFTPRPVRWPGLEGQLRRAREHNQERHVDTWNQERLSARTGAREGARRPPPVIGAPRLFISYCWESQEHEAWTDRLAGALYSRGYDLVYDRHPEWIDEPLSADELVYRIAECTHVVAVVTEAYREAILLPPRGPAPWVRRDASWAKREWERARALQGMDVLELVRAWRAGGDGSDGVEWDGTIDLRGEADIDDALDALFPPLGVVAVASLPDGKQIRTRPAIPRSEIAAVVDDMEERFAPELVRLYTEAAAPEGEPDPRSRWLALHSIDDEITRERMQRAAQLPTLRDVELQHEFVIDAKLARRREPASDDVLEAAISAAFSRLRAALPADLVLIKFGVAAHAVPERFLTELIQLVMDAPQPNVILLAGDAASQLMQGPLAQRPNNLAVLSKPVGGGPLEDVLECLFADRYG
jgi:hypothetical protein